MAFQKGILKFLTAKGRGSAVCKGGGKFTGEIFSPSRGAFRGGRGRSLVSIRGDFPLARDRGKKMAKNEGLVSPSPLRRGILQGYFSLGEVDCWKLYNYALGGVSCVEGIIGERGYASGRVLTGGEMLLDSPRKVA